MSERFTCLDVAKAFDLGSSVKKGREIYFKAPYRTDRNPSLRINPQKDVWFDDPAKIGGDAWHLAAKLAGLSPDDETAVKDCLRTHGLINGKDDNHRAPSAGLPSTWKGRQISHWYD